jgi:AP-2 complex subunit mu-1
MISAVLFVDLKGDIVISRYYRDDVTRQTTDAFRLQVIAAKKTDVPVVNIASASFLYLRHNDMYLVAVTRRNSNPTLIFAFLYRLIDIFKAYFGGEFDEKSVRNNFVLIYELLDEVADFGYPQITSTDMLSSFIKMASAPIEKGIDAPDDTQITSQITGAVDWRQAGKFLYRKNEVYIDVLEAVNVMVSATGDLLKADVSGRVMMKTFLSGMPDCRFGMNDKVLMDRRKGGGGGKQMSIPGNKNAAKSDGGIAIDDLSFHRCVRLGQFEADRTINFTPPDGEFELMSYRITRNINLPFRVVPVVTEMGRGRVEYNINVKGVFGSKLNATNVVLSIPTPHNAAKCNLKCSNGRAKYNPISHCIEWKMSKFGGAQSHTLTGECRLMMSVEEKVWSRPPITMSFVVPSFTASGLHVRYLKVIERSGYPVVKWVRYITRAGHYSIRI